LFGFQRRVPALPPTFMFGVATADHQCEAYNPDCPDVWDVWEHEHDLPRRDQATDFWNRYEEDIRYARELGCKLFRFSIAWARVETSPGTFDDEAFAHYRSIVDCIVEAGMEPFVTLLHFTWPQYIEREDGLLADDFPERFATYARKSAERLGDRVQYWVTINEPGNLVAGFVRFWWMPPEKFNERFSKARTSSATSAGA
jgi:beta-glucosidase/6-phospho-beta-glucosidase/beta-galactosidase